MKNIIWLGVLFLVICLALPLGVYAWSFRGHNLSTSTGDWGNFGSYLSGTGGLLLSALSFAGLIATLIITIINNTETKKLAQATLDETKCNFEKQINMQEEISIYDKKMREIEYNQNYFKMLLESLNSKLDNKKYNVYSPRYQTNITYNESEFLQEAFNFYDDILMIDSSNDETDSAEQKLHLISTVLDCGVILDNYLNIKYPEEITILVNLIEIINRSDSDDIKNDLIQQFHAGTYRDRTFWLLIYAIDQLELVRSFIWKHPGILALPQHMMENPPPLHNAS